MKTLRAALLLLVALPLPLALAAPKAKAPAAAPTAAPGHAHAEGGECHHPPEPAKAAAAKAPAAGEGWVLTRGEPLKGAPTVTLAELLRAPEAHAGKRVRVEGQVRRACERKGCWLELAEGASGSKGPGVRVTFKDYGFFVPLDSAGASARVEGVVQVAELSEARAQHYTSEGATVPRGADGKPREVQLVASGVELRR
ncbi:DUF4920 domain-containing protein [Aggregicoccus sp. 17bor-14]|uniref:DUF4920 domain-containing protein n=1 Tax=Myxococcaceae TaxID=31 RepID=UPI00129C76F3|nr:MULTISPECIES: DUF4920 domain-containing protein [Myxococcaceae]MBF5043724.1 DUF4920 domain-containing protein [Simulacricoccus sp. 17bor-14]MRI89480.1 DUF4920 domain-containing protein [Aggregicoccus sp. 17bor-14]